MTNLPARPVLTVRARRDTLVLVASAAAVTLLLANAVHHRPAPVSLAATAVVPESPEQTQWVGALADPAMTPVRSPEPLTSASLVVAKTLLPKSPAIRTATQSNIPVKRCDGGTCPTIPAAGSPVKTVALVSAPTHVEPRRPIKTGWFNGGLNSLKRLPDVVRHPFDVAGDAVTGWISRL